MKKVAGRISSVERERGKRQDEGNGWTRVECSDGDGSVAPLKTNKQLKMRCSFKFRRGAACCCLKVVLTFNFNFTASCHNVAHVWVYVKFSVCVYGKFSLIVHRLTKQAISLAWIRKQCRLATSNLTLILNSASFYYNWDH